MRTSKHLKALQPEAPKRPKPSQIHPSQKGLAGRFDQPRSLLTAKALRQANAGVVLYANAGLAVLELRGSGLICLGTGDLQVQKRSRLKLQVSYHVLRDDSTLNHRNLDGETQELHGHGSCTAAWARKGSGV